jgi:multicomponent K+:H+ antiporter subunit E
MSRPPTPPETPRPARPPSPPKAALGAWPHPALSVLLAAVWLLLQQSLSLPNLLAAGVMAYLLPRLVHGFIGEATHPRSLATILRFTLLVLWDIVVSNIAVARIVLSPSSKPQPAWVEVPLDTRHPTAITLLATVITMTPGTVSCVVDDSRGKILVHVLDCQDGPALVAQIKQRYEQPLMEIFG